MQAGHLPCCLRGANQLWYQVLRPIYFTQKQTNENPFHIKQGNLSSALVPSTTANSLLPTVFPPGVFKLFSSSILIIKLPLPAGP